MLCATSDETAWCFAWHHAELAAFFRLTRVTPEGLLELVDKARLMAAARVAGDVPAPAPVEEGEESLGERDSAALDVRLHR